MTLRWMGVLVLLALVGGQQSVAGDFDACFVLAREQQNYRCFGEVAGRTGRWVEAQHHLDRLLSEDSENPEAWWALAYVREGLAREDAGEAYFTAAELFRKAERFDAEAQVRLYLQGWLWDRGELEEAIRTLESASEAAANSHSDALVGHARISEALIAGRLGRIDEAEQLLLGAEPLLDTLPSWLQSLWFSNRAKNLWSQNELEAAAELYVRAADLRHEQGNYYWEASDRLALAQVVNAEKMIPAYREAKRIGELGGNRVVVAKAELALGRNDLNVENGRRRMRAALAELTETQRHLDISSAAQTIAVDLARREPQDWSAAQLYYQQAIDAARRAGSQHAVASVLATRNNDLWEVAAEDLVARDAALRDGWNTLEAIEAVRDLQLDSLMRARSFSAWRLTYERLVGRVLSPSLEGQEADHQAAFAITERMRARILLDEMDAARVAESREGVRFVRRAELLREMARLRGGMAATRLSEDQRENWLAQLAELRSEEQALRAELARDDPQFALVRGSDPVDLQSVQRALDPNEAIISFQLGDWERDSSFGGGAWVMLYTQHQERAFKIDYGPQTREALESYRVIAASRISVPDAAAVRLYKLLLAEALEALPATVSNLVFIVDKELHRFPFAGLKPALTAPPLSVRYSISRVPSATLWLRWKVAKRVEHSRSLLAFADPRGTTNEDPSGKRPWRSLPYARKEGELAVAQLDRGAALRVGEQATETAVKSTAARDFGILHFATHAWVDSARPDRSMVLLEADEAAGEDGRLHLDEIAKLELTGAVVVLSACQSASGAIVESEGVMNLARGFFVSGASAVIGTLWPIRDDDAAAFFDAFYRAVDAGRPVGEAFRAAQLAQIERGAPQGAWAGLVLIGNRELQPVQPSEPRGWMAWVAIATLAFLTWVTLHRWSRVKKNEHSR